MWGEEGLERPQMIRGKDEFILVSAADQIIAKEKRGQQNHGRGKRQPFLEGKGNETMGGKKGNKCISCNFERTLDSGLPG